MCSDSEKNMSAFADQNHAPSLTCVRLEDCRNVNSVSQAILPRQAIVSYRGKIADWRFHNLKFSSTKQDLKSASGPVVPFRTSSSRAAPRNIRAEHPRRRL